MKYENFEKYRKNDVLWDLDMYKLSGISINTI